MIAFLCGRRGPALESAAALLLAAFAAPSEAAEPGAERPDLVALVWQGPPGIHDCMTKEALRGAVEADLGRAVFADERVETETRLHVEITRDGASGYRALLRVEDTTGRAWGQRELASDGESCAALAEPLTLAVTLMVDAELLVPPPAAERKPDAEPRVRSGPPPRLVIRNPRRPDEPPAPTRPWSFAADAQLVASESLLPGLAFGADAGGRAVPPVGPPFRVHAAFFPGSDVAIESAGSASFQLAYAGVAVCPDLDRGEHHTISVCAGADAGFLRAQTNGVEGAKETTRLVLQGALSVAMDFVLSPPWVIRATAALLPPLERDRFVIERPDGTDELLFERSPLTWALGLGAGVDFGR